MLKWISKVNEINPEDKIIIHGLSMGGGIALDLADKDMKNVRGIISDAPSVSIRLLYFLVVIVEMGCISRRNCISGK